jgi:hypothetical protein
MDRIEIAAPESNGEDVFSQYQEKVAFGIRKIKMAITAGPKNTLLRLCRCPDYGVHPTLTVFITRKKEGIILTYGFTSIGGSIFIFRLTRRKTTFTFTTEDYFERNE